MSWTAAMRRIGAIALLLLALTASSARAIGTDLENQVAFGNYTGAQVDVGGALLPAECPPPASAR